MYWDPGPGPISSETYDGYRPTGALATSTSYQRLPTETSLFICRSAVSPEAQTIRGNLSSPDQAHTVRIEFPIDFQYPYLTSPHRPLSKMPGESYLVIGGCGFLGRHIVEQLLARGESQVAVFDIVQRHFDK